MSTVNWKRQDQFWWNFTLPSFQSPWSPPPLPPVLSPPVQEVVTFRIFSHFRHLKVNLNLSHLWKQTWIVGALLPFEHRHLALLTTNPLHRVLPLESLPETTSNASFEISPNWTLQVFYVLCSLFFTLNVAPTAVLKHYIIVAMCGRNCSE